MSGTGRIVCALSGSVDSAVAAHLLKSQGYEVIGLFIKHGQFTEGEGLKAERAEYACNKLQIPFRQTTLNSAWKALTQSVLTSYEEGKTPDISSQYQHHMICRGAQEFAVNQLEADSLATGHYARSKVAKSINVRGNVRIHKLLRGLDQRHDDSFYLSQCSQETLKKLVLPLGDFTKDIVPKVADSAGLNALTDFDSKGRKSLSHTLKDIICQIIPQRTGSLINIEDKNIIGKHEGVHNFHIGQRVTIGDRDDYYVTEKNYQSQEVTVAQGQDHPALYVENVFLSLFNWVSEVPYFLYIDGTMECDIKCHPRGPLVKCSVMAGRGSPWCGQEETILTKRDPLRAMIPGHFVAAYRGEECLGSASVLRTGPSVFAMNHGKYVSNREHKDRSVSSKLQSVIEKLKPS